VRRARRRGRRRPGRAALWHALWQDGRPGGPMAAAAAPSSPPAGALPEPAPSRAYTGYVVVVLSLMNLLNHVDRNIVSVLLQQIGEEFHASDEWLGLLTGMAFMLVHATMGIPIA